MKLSLVAAVFLAAFGGAAHAEEADDIREASKAEAETFNARMYAGAPGNKAYACFVRRYDPEHLARHPQQKVAAMKLLVTGGNGHGRQAAHYSFRLGFKFRRRSGNFDSSGACGPPVHQETAHKIRSAAASTARAAASPSRFTDDKSAIVRLERVRIWQNNKPDDGANDHWSPAPTTGFSGSTAPRSRHVPLARDRPQGTRRRSAHAYSNKENVMNRRNMFWSAASGLGAAVGASRASAATRRRRPTSRRWSIISATPTRSSSCSAISGTTSMASAAPIMSRSRW